MYAIQNFHACYTDTCWELQNDAHVDVLAYAVPVSIHFHGNINWNESVFLYVLAFRVKFGSENLFIGCCSYTLAIEFQQRVIDAWEGHGPSAEDELREAQRILEELKTKARGTSTNRLPTKALPLPQNSLAARNSQPSVPVTQN